MMDEQEEPKRTDYSGLIILAIVAPVYLTFAFIGREQIGSSAAIVLGMTLLAVRVRWDLRRRVWFWAVILFMLALQAPLLFLVRWPRGWVPKVVLLPIGLADALIILGLIYAVEKFMGKGEAAKNV